MKRTLWAAVGLTVLVILGRAYVWFAGSVTVHDETGSVTAAVITNGELEYPLNRLPGGTFFRVMPRFDGLIEVRCRNGSTHRDTYVTHHSETTVRVVDDAPCRFETEQDD